MLMLPAARISDVRMDVVTHLATVALALIVSL